MVLWTSSPPKDNSKKGVDQSPEKGSNKQTMAEESDSDDTQSREGESSEASEEMDDSSIGANKVVEDQSSEVEEEEESTGSHEDQEQEATASSSLLSKSWSIAQAHVSTFTGGTVTACRSKNCLLLPVHGDVAMVDSILGVKVGTIRRGNDASLELQKGNGDPHEEEDDEEEGVDYDSITAYAIDHKDETLITCSRNFLLRQYSLQQNAGDSVDEEPEKNASSPPITRKLIKTWGRSGHTLPVTCMSFHLSNIFLATGSVDGSVRIWDVRGSYVTHVFRPMAGSGDDGSSHTGRHGVTALSWRQELGQLILAIAREDGSVTIHNLRDTNNENVVVLRDHVSAVTSMNWWWAGSPGDEAQPHSDEFFVSTGRDAILNLWRIVPIVASEEGDDQKRESTKKKKKKKKGGEQALVTTPKVSYRRIQSIPVYEQVEGMVIVRSKKHPKDLHVVTAGSKGMVRTWKTTPVHGQTPKLELTLEQPPSVAFGESRGGYMGLVLNEKAIADKNKKEQFIAVDAEHNLSFLSSKLAVTRTIVGHNDEILDLKVIPSESNSIVVATNSPQIRIFELANFSCHVIDGHTATVLCVDASPCGRYVVSSGKDKTMRLWRVQDRKCLAIATGHTEPIGACSLSQKVGRYEVGGKAAKNGGGAFCITASMDRTLKRWNLPGPEEFVSIEEPISLPAAMSIRAHEKDINIISVAPNDSLVASGSQDKTIKLWNSTDMTLRATLKGHRRGVWDCQFSPIDRVLASSSGDKTIKLWSLGDFSCVRTFQGHLSSVLRVRFLKTGLQLLSAGADGLMKLWTVRTNECESTLDGHSSKVWALDLHPDGKTAISGGADSKLAVWKDNTQQVEDEKRAEEAEAIRLDQKLANHLRYREYGKALEIALQVEKPLKALKVIVAIIEDDIQKGTGTGLGPLQGHVKKWNMDRVAQVLKYCRDWNTRARNAPVAMLVVQAIVTSIPVDKLSRGPGVPEIMAGIVPYAERHFERLDRLHTSTYLLDFTLANMGDLDPDVISDSEQDFLRWEASSKLVLPPKFVDGRIQIGGKDIIGKGKAAIKDDSGDESDDEVQTIGDSSTDQSSAGGPEDDEMSLDEEAPKADDAQESSDSDDGSTSDSS